MIQKNILVFTDEEEELISLLREIGMQKTIAQVLVFLANIPEATSHTIERGTDLPQANISVALKHLRKRGWVASLTVPVTTGMAVNHHKLALPFSEIVDCIEREKTDEIHHLLERVGKIQDYL